MLKYVADTDEALQVVLTSKSNRVVRKHRSTGNTEEMTEEELAAKLLPGNDNAFKYN